MHGAGEGCEESFKLSLQGQRGKQEKVRHAPLSTQHSALSVNRTLSCLRSTKKARRPNTQEDNNFCHIHMQESPCSYGGVGKSKMLAKSDTTNALQQAADSISAAK